MDGWHLCLAVYVRSCCQTRVSGERCRHPACEAHRPQWLSCRGRDEYQSLVLICPNHHQAEQVCDAHLDHTWGAMDFGTRGEAVRVCPLLRTAQLPNSLGPVHYARNRVK